MKSVILLSTFNGERWLPELLRSLAAQSSPVDIFWRDDGSTDNSRYVVESFKRLKIIQSDHSPPGSNVGACASFSLLIQAALSNTTAQYFFFADQDDVWHEEKVKLMLRSAEDYYLTAPLLLHHDLEVVDQEGERIAPSLWRYMKLNPSANTLEYFLTRNSVTGCASMINRPLANLVAPIPSEAHMHDWWTAMVASVAGEIRCLSDPLVRYRQHGDNTLGAKAWWHGLNPCTNWYAGWKRGNDEYRSLFTQAQALERHLNDLRIPSSSARILLQRFSNLPSEPMPQRLWLAHNMGLRRDGVILWLIAMIRIALTKVP